MFSAMRPSTCRDPATLRAKLKYRKCGDLSPYLLLSCAP